MNQNNTLITPTMNTTPYQSNLNQMLYYNNSANNTATNHNNLNNNLNPDKLNNNNNNNFLISKYYNNFFKHLKLKNLTKDDFDLIKFYPLTITSLLSALIIDRYHTARYLLYGGSTTIRLFNIGIHFSIFYYSLHNLKSIYKEIENAKSLNNYNNNNNKQENNLNNTFNKNLI